MSAKKTTYQTENAPTTNAVPAYTGISDDLTSASAKGLALGGPYNNGPTAGYGLAGNSADVLAYQKEMYERGQAEREQATAQNRRATALSTAAQIYSMFGLKGGVDELIAEARKIEQYLVDPRQGLN